MASRVEAQAAAVPDARHLPPRVIMHQATCAVRLAEATVATRAGLRSSIATMRESAAAGFVQARRSSEVMPTTSGRRK